MVDRFNYDPPQETYWYGAGGEKQKRAIANLGAVFKLPCGGAWILGCKRGDNFAVQVNYAADSYDFFVSSYLFNESHPKWHEIKLEVAKNEQTVLVDRSFSEFEGEYLAK